METNVIHIDITNVPDEIFIFRPGLSNAIANDGIDDSMAIQAVIDWLTVQREAGFVEEAIVYLPEGVFDLANTLEVNTSNITFEGAGAGITILQNDDLFQVGTEGLPDSGVNVSSVNRDAYLFDLAQNADDVVFSEMTLTGPEVHGAIFGYRSDSLAIRDVEFNDFAWSSIRLFNLNGARIYDNVFIDAGGQANGTTGVTGGSIYATYLRDSEIYNNEISRSGDRPGNVYGIKGRQFRNTRIHHNTINTNFAIELPFENDYFVEIDHNFLDGVVSIPKFGGGAVPEDGFTFHIHHNYFTRSYSLEWARNGAEINHNVFVFDIDQDGGNLISNFGSGPAEGEMKFHNNLILNPGRGIFWSRGVYNNFSFNNNHVVVNETITPRVGGLFGFNDETDFSTIEIVDNIIQVNGISRPLMRSEESYSAVVENNELTNISDTSQFGNPETTSPRGLIEPLIFHVGVNGEFIVDSNEIISSAPVSIMRIEAEDYKANSSAVPYYDTSSENLGGAYRPDEPVDIQTTSDVGAGFNVGWIDEGEYLTYDVNIETSGIYDVVARVATPKDGTRKLGIKFGTQSQDILEFEKTGSWQNWENVILQNVSLSSGLQELRLDFLTSGFNLNYIELIPKSTISNIIRIEAEDYKPVDNNEYYDTSSTNLGGAYRLNEPVDIQATSDIGGGFNVGWIDEGEYLTYDVEVETAGTYDLIARIATPEDTTKRLGITFDDQSQQIIEFSGTGGWQAWESITLSGLILSAGLQELRLDFLSSNFNLNYVALIPKAV